MRAAYGLGSLRFELREIAVPEPTEGQALVRVKACAICGSDKHEHSQAEVADRVSGHEISGVVERVAGTATDLEPGDEVCLAPLWFCGKCKYCAVGRTSSCISPEGVIGYTMPGGFAEYTTAPVRTMCPKPSGISFEQAALTEPLAVAVRAVSILDVAAHDCLVFGAGAIGLMLAQVLKTRGAGQIFLTDIDEGHLELANQLGDFVTLQSDDPAQWRKLEAADIRIAFDAVGNVPAITQRAVERVKPGGACVLIGAQDPDVLAATDFAHKRISLLFSEGVHMSEMDEASRLMQTGEVDLGPLLSGTYPLERIEDAFEAARSGVKVIVEP